jgi:low temperature requirement protein LtrA
MPRLPVRRRREPAVAGSVTTLELFFDLVFVFTITQLTATLGQDHGWGGVGRVVLLLLLMWWMYGGYAWLTNAAPPVTPVRRVFLLVGMAGNLTMALAIPHAYTTDRVVFAVGYVVVAAVHTGMYLTQAERITPGMVVQLVAWNGIAVLLILVGALLGDTSLVVLWVAALLAETMLPRLAARTPLARLDSGPAFTLRPGHFVERHGLMLLIVLGESVLAIGVGVGSGETAIGVGQVVFAAISLGLAVLLYAAYFGTHEDEVAEHALEQVPQARQQAVALRSFGYAFVVVLLGVVLAAAGLHHALEHPTAPLDLGYAALLAGGVGTTWVGFGAFRWAVGRAGAGVRVAGGVVLAAATWLGQVSAFVELLALILGSMAILLLPNRTQKLPTISGPEPRNSETSESGRGGPGNL